MEKEIPILYDIFQDFLTYLKYLGKHYLVEFRIKIFHIQHTAPGLFPPKISTFQALDTWIPYLASSRGPESPSGKSSEKSSAGTNAIQGDLIRVRVGVHLDHH